MVVERPFPSESGAGGDGAASCTSSVNARPSKKSSLSTSGSGSAWEDSAACTSSVCTSSVNIRPSKKSSLSASGSGSAWENSAACISFVFTSSFNVRPSKKSASSLSDTGEAGPTSSSASISAKLSKNSISSLSDSSFAGSVLDSFSNGERPVSLATSSGLTFGVLFCVIVPLPAFKKIWLQKQAKICPLQLTKMGNKKDRKLLLDGSIHI